MPLYDDVFVLDNFSAVSHPSDEENEVEVVLTRIGVSTSEIARQWLEVNDVTT